MRSRGWTYIVRPPAETQPVAEPLAALPVLQVGSRGQIVTDVQKFALTNFGAYAGTIRNTGGADGVYGAGTKAWVVEFQRRCGIKATGVVAADTWAKLYRYGFKRTVTL